MNKDIIPFGFSMFLAVLFYSGTGFFIMTPATLLGVPLSVLVGLKLIYPVFRYAFSRGVSFFGSLAFVLFTNIIIASLPLCIVLLGTKFVSSPGSGDVIGLFVMPFVLVWLIAFFFSLPFSLYRILKNKSTISIDTQTVLPIKLLWFVTTLATVLVILSSNPIPRIVSLLSIQRLSPLCTLSIDKISTRACLERLTRKESIHKLQKDNGIHVIQTSYDTINGLTIDDGRVIFSGTRKKGLNKEKLISINGIENKKYSIVGEPLVINNKIAFITSRMIGEQAKYSVHYDEDVVQEDISMNTQLFEHNGHLGYIIIEGENTFYILDQQKFGDNDSGEKNIDFLPVGNGVAYTVQKNDVYSVKYDGNTLWEGHDKPTLLYDLHGIPVFSFNHKEKNQGRDAVFTHVFINTQEVGANFNSKSHFDFDGDAMVFVVEDEKMGGQKIYQRGNLFGRENSPYGYGTILGPFLVQGKLYYAGVDYTSNAKTDMIIDGHVVYSVPGVASDLIISKGGKTALYMGTNDRKIYLDGKQLQYQEGNSVHSWGFSPTLISQPGKGKQRSQSSYMQFIGEKLLYWTINKNGIDSLCIDGDLLIEGFTEYLGESSDDHSSILAISKQGKSSVSFIVFGSPDWLDEFQKNINEL